VRFERFTYDGEMAGAIAHDQAQRLRAALEGVFKESGDSLDVSGSARDAFLRLVDVLESSPEAVVLPSDTVFSTQKAAEMLGVSRMTVVRLIDRGELAAEGGGVHRRIAVAELARYRTASAARRTAALHSLAQEISEDTPPDQVISTR
jgi:excisionase family DNA binding protein